MGNNGQSLYLKRSNGTSLYGTFGDLHIVQAKIKEHLSSGISTALTQLLNFVLGILEC
jgi:hypothetical protein